MIDLVNGMMRADAYPHSVDQIEHIETHISHVFLAGDFAYKIKKPLKLPFLDFSTLERRFFCCQEELRLNRRLAPSLYLDVVALRASDGELCIAEAMEAEAMEAEAMEARGVEARGVEARIGAPIEYAVKMRRFDQGALLTGTVLGADLAGRLGDLLAAFHRGVDAAPADSDYGSSHKVVRPVLDNFRDLGEHCLDSETRDKLRQIQAWTQERYGALQAKFDGRKRDGWIRECHGDMHRGNIAVIDGEVVVFDGIDFNPDLRWIDTMSELAFLVMDLEMTGESAAGLLLNRYLEHSGDYEGLEVLDFYKVYRAMVRAKVDILRIGQEDLSTEAGAKEAAQLESDFRQYIDLALGYTQPRKPTLVITHGLSGSGKSTAAAQLRQRFPYVHIRSDVERKRLLGPGTGSGVGKGIYDATGTDLTYVRLRELASRVLGAGYSPIVDATFLKHAKRKAFADLATSLDCSYLILDCQAESQSLRARIRGRQAQGIDPSDADLAVLDAQLADQDPLTPEERAVAMTIRSPADIRIPG